MVFGEFLYNRRKAFIRLTAVAWYCMHGCISSLILIDFSLTAKAVTLIFIYERGSTISFAKQGKSGSIYKAGDKLISCFGRANALAFHENPNLIHTELTFINP